jgi:hypothetical protein
VKHLGEIRKNRNGEDEIRISEKTDFKKVKKSCSAVPFQQNLRTNFYCWYWLNVLLFEFSFEVVIARAWLTRTFQRTKKITENLLEHAVYPRMKETDIL